MDQPPPQRPKGADRELLESPSDADSGRRPVLLRSAVRVRSPMLEDRSMGRPAPDPVRASLILPPLHTLVRPLFWSLMVAIPVLVQVGWQTALVAGAVVFVVRELRVRVRLTTVTFGAGFLPYRAQDGWPHGVQEDDDFRWHWSALRTVGAGHGAGD